MRSHSITSLAIRKSGAALSVRTQKKQKRYQSIPSRPKVILPDQRMVEKAYEFAPSQFESMIIADKEWQNWEVIASDFVLKPKENSRVKTFIEIVQNVKVKVERKMRRDLD